eukprot:758436-Rhodomonas_salina.4
MTRHKKRQEEEREKRGAEGKTNMVSVRTAGMREVRRSDVCTAPVAGPADQATSQRAFVSLLQPVLT